MTPILWVIAYLLVGVAISVAFSVIDKLQGSSDNDGFFGLMVFMWIVIVPMWFLILVLPRWIDAIAEVVIKVMKWRP